MALQAEGKLGFGAYQPVRIAYDEAFGQGKRGCFQEIIHGPYLHFVQEGFFADVFVVRAFGQDVFIVIGQDGLAVADGGCVEYGQDVVRQEIFVKQPSCAPLDDFTAVVGQDKSAMFFHLQGVRQGGDAIRGAAGGQYQPHALLLEAEQGLAVAWRNLFL